jgi:hypothetical protein
MHRVNLPSQRQGWCRRRQPFPAVIAISQRLERLYRRDDGRRVQLDKAGVSSIIYGRKGGDLSRRFPRIAAAVLGLPAKSCIFDGDSRSTPCATTRATASFAGQRQEQSAALQR